MPGLFLTFEGGDGSGKSTQSALLTDWLIEQGHTVVHSREPGGSDFGLEVRELVLHRRGHIAARAEALLYAADRAHNIATVVRPALERGDVVIQDRYLDSSVAYQGAGRVLDPAEVRDLSLWATENLLPDLTVLLDLARETPGARGWMRRAPATTGSRRRPTTSTPGCGPDTWRSPPPSRSVSWCSTRRCPSTSWRRASVTECHPCSAKIQSTWDGMT